MMKKIILVLLIIGVVFAERSITGTTGYIAMPTAEGIKLHEYNLGLNAYSATSLTKSFWKTYASLGTAEGTELSFVGRSEREGLFLNIKWFGELNNYENPLYAAFGFENVSSLGTYGDYPNLYMVMTKKFMQSSSFSVGFVSRYMNKSVKASMMAGFEIFTSSSLSWVFDTVSYQDSKYTCDFGLRYYTSSNLCFSLYGLNLVRDNTNPKYNPSIVTLGITATNIL